jgi:hypothetical protein
MHSDSICWRHWLVLWELRFLLLPWKPTTFPQINTALHRLITQHFLHLQILSILFSYLKLIKPQSPWCVIYTKCQSSTSELLGTITKPQARSCNNPACDTQKISLSTRYVTQSLKEKRNQFTQSCKNQWPHIFFYDTTAPRGPWPPHF